MKTWTIQEIPRQDGRRVLVTGGASGIGFQVARVLGSKGARVLIANRDADKGAQALADLRRTVPDGEFTFSKLDLAALHSVSEFTDSVLGTEEPLDLLLNVAGVMAVPKRTTTIDGFEMQMGTNYLGHFALTGRLLPALKRAKQPRVVTVTAAVARWAKLDLGDLQSEGSYGPMRAYGASKLADLMFAVELNRRAIGTGISSIGVDPGTANTSLQRHTPGVVRWLGAKLINVIGYPLDRVADPVVFAATVQEPDDQTYVRPSKVIQSSGPPAYLPLPGTASDARARARLWQQSEELTGVHYDLPT